MQAPDIANTPVGTRLIYRATDDRGYSRDLHCAFLRITRKRVVVKLVDGSVRAVSHKNLRFDTSN